jgi:hypothetical protein
MKEDKKDDEKGTSREMQTSDQSFDKVHFTHREKSD